MNELHCDTLWKTIRRLARKSAVKRAAVAYVTSDEMVRFSVHELTREFPAEAEDIARPNGTPLPWLRRRSWWFTLTGVFAASERGRYECDGRSGAGPTG